MILVYAYICGDILHKGHLEALRNAKALGDKLIVGVLTDEAVMEKKPRPAMSFDERFDMVRSLDMVDIVVAQHEYSPLKNVVKMQIDVLAESDSHEHVTKKFIDFLATKGVRVVCYPYFPGHSSTEIKNKVKNG